MNPVADITGDQAQIQKRPRGRPVGSVNKIQQLARENLTALFEMNGGVQGMFKWLQKNERNEYAFYVYIYPKILGVQGVQKPQGPVVANITNVIVDPRNNYKGSIDASAVDVTPQREPRYDPQDHEFNAVDKGTPEVIEEVPVYEPQQLQSRKSDDFEISGEIPL